MPLSFVIKKKLNVTLSDINSEPNNFYDLITLFDTIEHFYDPIKEMRSIAKKIKKKSFLLAFTPNIHSLSFELMKDEHNMFSVFDHMNFFNLKSLNYLSDKIGLKIISIEYLGLDIKDYFQFIEAKKNIKINKLTNKFSNLTQSIIDESKLSNSMRIIFQKI